jgi:hypothetical protein
MLADTLAPESLPPVDTLAPLLLLRSPRPTEADTPLSLDTPKLTDIAFAEKLKNNKSTTPAIILNTDLQAM